MSIKKTLKWNFFCSTYKYDTLKHVHYVCLSIHNQLILYRILLGVLKRVFNHVSLMLSPLKIVVEDMCLIRRLYKSSRLTNPPNHIKRALSIGRVVTW